MMQQMAHAAQQQMHQHHMIQQQIVHLNSGAYGTWPGDIGPAVFPGAVPMHSAGMMQVPGMGAAAAASFPVANGSEVASQAGATSDFATALFRFDF